MCLLATMTRILPGKPVKQSTLPFTHLRAMNGSAAPRLGQAPPTLPSYVITLASSPAQPPLFMPVVLLVRTVTRCMLILTARVNPLRSIPRLVRQPVLEPN